MCGLNTFVRVDVTDVIRQACSAFFYYYFIFLLGLQSHFLNSSVQVEHLTKRKTQPATVWLREERGRGGGPEGGVAWAVRSRGDPPEASPA